MKTQIHHAALSVTEFDRYVELFQKAFDMRPEKQSGERPHRKIWFREGIQLNEHKIPPDSDPTGDGPVGMPGNRAAEGSFDHIGISVDNPEELLKRAKRYGCTPLPEGKNWFALPNGIRIELKE